MARIGVLSLQGGFAAHARALADLGHRPVEVRAPADLDGLDGLVLPGGESTAQLLLIDRHRLESALSQFAASGRPILATCAGLILAAGRVTTPEQRSFGWIDATVSRNAWGRQLDSFEATTDEHCLAASGERGPMPLVFIRAPRILHSGDDVRVLASLHGEPILIQQRNVTGATFHPELTSDRRVHRAAFGAGAQTTTFAA
ncbi:MAG TPA: pyridoxal 5'-phosphate synthase glutaminase subunit PdxT [Myxococcaceae bacterium]|nr:pyridoxal 5'-phosphate synthase glutaminase subunit PdxT [Myxococcaceae bacterium]